MTKSHPARKCHLCGIIYTEYPALSRADSKTEICSACGTREAYIKQDAASFIKLWSQAPKLPPASLRNKLQDRLLRETKNKEK